MSATDSIVKSLCFTGGVAAGLALREGPVVPEWGWPFCVAILPALPLLFTYFFWKKGQEKEIFFRICVFVTGLFCGVMGGAAAEGLWAGGAGSVEGWAGGTEYGGFGTASGGAGGWTGKAGDGDPMAGWSPQRFAARLRALIADIPYPHEDTGPLVTALLTGERSSLSREIRRAFRLSGASHLLALSGMHVGLLCLVAEKALSLFGNRPVWKKTRGVLLVLLCGFYTLAVGAGPSIVRAFFFILLRQTAILLERKVRPSDILSGALILQLCITPAALKSIGFQLSYLAMAGIVFLMPRLSALYPGKWLKKIWDLCALSLSCQAFTGPLVWWKFGAFPPYFLLTNLLSAPLMTLVMVSSLLSVSVAVLGLDGTLVYALNDALARALIFSLDVIAGM